jgi:hypothetical protein
MLPGSSDRSRRAALKRRRMNLERLLDLKDGAQYGVIDVTGQRLRQAIRQAEALVDFARGTIARNR